MENMNFIKYIRLYLVCKNNTRERFNIKLSLSALNPEYRFMESNIPKYSILNLYNMLNIEVV